MNFNPAAGTGQVPEVGNQIAHEHYFLGRFDYTLSDKDSLFARYFFDKQHVIVTTLATLGEAAAASTATSATAPAMSATVRRLILPTLAGVGAAGVAVSAAPCA